MKVAVVFRNGEHSHDYLIQHLFAGFCDLLGEENILDYPRNPYCHLREITPGSRLPDPAARDECNLDSDQAYPVVDVQGPFGLIIGGAHAPTETQEAIKQWPSATVAWIDGSDNACQNAGPGVQFKRELPIGATWAHPLPLTYPEHRIPKVKVERHGVVYYASTHGDIAIDRMRIAYGLRQLPDARVHTTPNQKDRPSTEAHHEALWSALVGVHWNPLVPLDKMNEHSSGWDANRFPESLAFGVAVVALRPFITIPYPFTDGENIVYANTSDEVVSKVKELLDNPERARAIGKAGHKHFLKYHCATARARYIIDLTGG